jgi:hypothetical protein
MGDAPYVSRNQQIAGGLQAAPRIEYVKISGIIEKSLRAKTLAFHTGR